MSRLRLLEKLDKATDRAASHAIRLGLPISNAKKGVYIGDTLVEKNTNGAYDVLTLDRKPLYMNISVFDVAIIIGQRHTDRDMSVVKKVLALEEKFSKYHNDMLHYLHCMRGAKKRADYDKMAILEDKFQMSELHAKETRDQISRFKRSK